MGRKSAIWIGLLAALSYGAARAAEAAAEPLVTKALKAMHGAEEVVFVERAIYRDGHFYRNFGGDSIDPNQWFHAPDGSRLCKINLRTKQVTVIMEVAKGDIRDPRVDYEGKKLLFAYRKGGTHNYNLYELNLDGTGLKQLTFGEKWDDFGPEYLPDGGIIFVSSRGKRFVPCNHSPGAQIFRMNGDGSDILCLSANNVRDDRPTIMPNGQILYDRWEYVDTAIGSYRDLWTMNPDGTNQQILYGGTVRPPEIGWGKCDALPIPGADGKIACIFSPYTWGYRENMGNLMVVDVKAGPDDSSATKRIGPMQFDGRLYAGWGGNGERGFRDPYPLSEDCFLVAKDKSLLVIDGQGRMEEFYGGKTLVHDPRVIGPRPREVVIPPRIDRQRTTGQFILADVYRGRPAEMDGVKRGSIKKLLILEDLPKPVSYFSLPGMLSQDGTHTLRRVLGTVPVEADGSASFEAPPLRALYFVALDENDIAVKRMQSYTMLMPGETQGCVGCHEPRTATAAPNVGSTLLAMTRRPSKIERSAGVPEVFDYPRDIQPIWDRHCVSCHSAEKPEGHAILTGDRNEWFTQSYYTLFAYDQVSHMRGRYRSEFRGHKPYGFGTGASPLMKKIDGSHHGVTLSQEEHDKVRLWIEASAYFAGTYAVFNHAENAVAGALVNSSRVEIGKPLDKIIERRCLICHDSAAQMGRRVTGRVRMNEPKHCWNLYNLSHPEKSMILLAPLAKEAGGYGWCVDPYGQPIDQFLDTNDPDYQTILRAICEAKARQEKNGRYDMPGFRNEYYVRWMKRWNILRQDFDWTKDALNPYETDAAYWRSLWYWPPTVSGTAMQGR